MAGFVDRFKRMWDAPDDEYEYGEYDNFKEDEEEEETPSRRSSSSSSSRGYETS